MNHIPLNELHNLPNRIGKTQLAEILGGGFIAPSGQINSQKLRDFVCRALNISETEYKANRLFTTPQIVQLYEKGILKPY